MDGHIEVILFYDGVSKGGKHKYATAAGSEVFATLYLPRKDKKVKPRSSMKIWVPAPEVDETSQ